MNKRAHFLIMLIISSLFIGCKSIKKKVNSNLMFQIEEDSAFKFDSIPLKPSTDYKIGPGDRFSFYFSTNDGEKIVYNLSGVDPNTNMNRMNASNLMIQDYLVRTDGTAELPVIGILKVSGLTAIQLEDTLVDILSKNYVSPFVQIKLTNQRVVIFSGRGVAQVLPLPNVNTTLLEVLASAGGIGEDGMANSIKLIRKTNEGKREVYKIDLSTIAGIKDSEMIVQSEDYIYIDIRPRIGGRVLKEIAPWVSTVTSAFAIMTILIRLQ
ncbi:MAG: hypothetical protein CL824_05740 [Crocinitomicaceae bacterium]|nr:hypothetical protein [Crocinitomicaceae bacterium]